MKSERLKYKVTNIKLEDLVRILVPGEFLTVNPENELPQSLEDIKDPFSLGKYACSEEDIVPNSFKICKDVDKINPHIWIWFSETGTNIVLDTTSEEIMSCLLTGEIEY